MPSESPSDFDWTLRAAVYSHFAEAGRAPSSEELATTAGARPDAVVASLHLTGSFWRLL